MKRATVLFTLFLAVKMMNLQAQVYFPAATDEQKWEYITWSFWFGDCDTRVIKTGTEQNLCGEVFREIWDCDANEQNCNLLGYYKVQEDSVWLRKYEVNAQPQVDCSLPPRLTYVFKLAENAAMTGSINGNHDATFVVNQKDTLNYLGTMRPTLATTYNYFGNSPTETAQMTWIQGIGSTVHPFYPLTFLGDNYEMEQGVSKVTLNGTVIFQQTPNFPVPCNNAVDIEQNRELSSFRIAPNPVEDVLSIGNEAINVKEAARVEIYDAIGRCYLKVEKYALYQNLDIQFLPKGVYQVVVKTSKGSATLKMVKA